MIAHLKILIPFNNKVLGFSKNCEELTNWRLIKTFQEEVCDLYAYSMTNFFFYILFVCVWLKHVSQTNLMGAMPKDLLPSIQSKDYKKEVKGYEGAFFNSDKNFLMRKENIIPVKRLFGKM